MISFTQCQFQLKDRLFKVPSLKINPLDYWTIVGGNGSGKSLLAKMLQNEQSYPLVEGTFNHTFKQVALLSFEQQQKILTSIFNSRNNDSVSPDDFGLTAREVIFAAPANATLGTYYAQRLGVAHLLERAFMQLSTGESRKVLLCHLLACEPDLLILDEPFEGLDQQSVQDWQNLLAELNQKMALVLIVNRFNDLPNQATHLALLDNLQLIAQGEVQAVKNEPTFAQLIYAETQVDVPLPCATQPLTQLTGNPFELKNVVVRYGEQTILNELSWTVQPRENWWIKGPNGAGKSTLLSILTGDHPQAYANHVILFGKQRGSGETVWDIKKNIGYVSSQLHMDYRVNCAVLDVVVSGFLDSIGVYQQVPAALKLKAMEWLRRLGLDALANKPFRSLSWGQQRLLLITRAMVKHPPILILDEPLQGLDGLNRKLVKQFIEQLVANSHTQLIFVSHQDLDAPNCITHLFEFVAENGSYHYQQRALT